MSWTRRSWTTTPEVADILAFGAARPLITDQPAAPRRGGGQRSPAPPPPWPPGTPDAPHAPLSARPHGSRETLRKKGASAKPGPRDPGAGGRG